jgi:hypothetical protein
MPPREVKVSSTLLAFFIILAALTSLLLPLAKEKPLDTINNTHNSAENIFTIYP